MRTVPFLVLLLTCSAVQAAEPRLRGGQWTFTLTDLDGARRGVEACIRAQADEHVALGLPDRAALPKGCSVSEHIDADQLGGRMTCSGKADLHYRMTVGSVATEGILQTGRLKTIVKGQRGGDC